MNPSHLGELLAPAVQEAERHFDEIDSTPVMPGEFTPQEIRDYLEREFSFEQPWELTPLIQEVSDRFTEWNVHTPHPCCFGLYNPAVTPAGIAGDLLTAAFNPQLAAYSHAPFANEVDRHMIQFFGKALGLDPCAGFFTSGGAEANTSSVMCAIAAAMPETLQRGLTVENKRPTIYVSGEAHHSFGKAAKMCGLGSDSVRQIGLRDDLTMDPALLEEAIAADQRDGLHPILVVATAGTTASGAIDPMTEIRAICDRHGLWMHADAAWAGAVRLSPRYAHLLDGVERADSVTWDAHKWLQAPMGAGMFFTRQPEVAQAAFAIETGYMPASMPGALDPYHSTPQWSRRAIGMKVFMDAAAEGREGLARRVDHMCAMGDLMKIRLKNEGWKIAAPSALPIACFSLPGLDLDAVLKKVYERRKIWISIARLANGQRALRACVTNWRTEERHIETLIEELSLAL